MKTRLTREGVTSADWPNFSKSPPIGENIIGMDVVRLGGLQLADEVCQSS